jgi:hypothetical protein
MTTRALGVHYGVSGQSVKRWLRRCDIPRRPANNGLIGRGVVPPTPDELRQMVHERHMSYPEIAALYGVDSTAVPHWLRKYGIPRPTAWETRRKGVVIAMPSEEELRRRYVAGETLVDIGKSLGISSTPVVKAFKEYGIEITPDGFQGGRRWECADGHLVRSSYEQRVDNWLSEHSLPHELEPRLPFDRRFRSDFLVGETYIEVWGVCGSTSYDERKKRKRALYRLHGVPLIDIHHWTFRRTESWHARLTTLLTETPSG